MYPQLSRAITWVDELIWRVIISTTFLHLHLFLYPVITIMSFLHLQHGQKNNRQGSSRYLWNELAYLPENSTDNRAPLSAPSVWGSESTRQRLPLVWFGSSPSFLQPHSCFMFVCYFSGFHGYHTHRRSERWAHQCFSGGRWMGLTHLWEVEKTRKVRCNATLSWRF